jgi:hypothetical protein
MDFMRNKLRSTTTLATRQIMNRKRILLIGALPVAVLLLALGLAVFYFPHWLQLRLEKKVHEDSKGLYSLEIRDLEASLFKKNLTLHGLVLKPDTGKWQALAKNRTAGLTTVLAALKVEKIQVNHLNYFGYLFKKPLELDSLTVFAPSLQVIRMQADTKKQKPVNKSFDGPLKDLRINSIRVKHGNFSYKNDFRNKFNNASLKDLDLQINKLALDSAASADPKRTFYAKSIVATAGETDLLMPNGDHRLKMNVISMGTRTREIKMKTIRLVPLYNTKELAQREKKNTLFLSVELPQLILKNFDFSVYSHSGAIAIDSVLMDDLKVAAFSDGANLAPKEVKPVSADTAAAKPFYKTLGGPFLKMKVNCLRLRNADCSYKNDYKEKFNTAALRNFDLQVNKLQLDSTSFFNPDRVFYAAAITAKADSVDLLLENGFYRLQGRSVAANSTAKEIQITNLRLVPVYGPQEMAQRKKRSTAWMKLTMPAVLLKEVNFPAYSRSGKIGIGSVLIENAELISYNDKKNFKEVKEEKLFPQDLVQRLKVGLDIGNIEVRNMYVRFDEFNEKATRPGHIALQGIQATIRNITNDKSKMSARNPTVTRLKLSFKNQGTMQLTSRLNLLDPNCNHSFKGSFGKCDLQVFNSLLEPTFALRIKSGMVKNGRFNMKLNRHSASGDMLLLYDNFKIQLLRSDGKSQSLGDRITSFFANAFVVKSQNPEDGNPPRRVAVNVTREGNQSFISYWRKCLQTGFMTSVGIEKAKK